MFTIKKSVLILMLLSVAAIISGCKKNTPESVAENFLEELESGDFEGAKKYATPDSEELLNMMGAKMEDNSEDVGNADFKIIRTEKNKDETEATVFYTVERDPGEKKLHLIKQDDEWKVSFTKGSMFNMDDLMEAMEEMDMGDMQIDIDESAMEEADSL